MIDQNFAQELLAQAPVVVALLWLFTRQNAMIEKCMEHFMKERDKE